MKTFFISLAALATLSHGVKFETEEDAFFGGHVRVIYNEMGGAVTGVT